MTNTPEKTAFQPGTIVATLGALQVVSQQQIAQIISRHLAGDWGDLEDEDKKANDRALKEGERLFPATRSPPTRSSG